MPSYNRIERLQLIMQYLNAAPRLTKHTPDSIGAALGIPYNSVRKTIYEDFGHIFDRDVVTGGVCLVMDQWPGGIPFDLEDLDPVVSRALGQVRDTHIIKTPTGKAYETSYVTNAPMVNAKSESTKPKVEHKWQADHFEEGLTQFELYVGHVVTRRAFKEMEVGSAEFWRRYMMLRAGYIFMASMRRKDGDAYIDEQVENGTNSIKLKELREMFKNDET